MTDRDDLEDLLAAAPPPAADPANRARNIAAAMTAFDTAQAEEKKTVTDQGTADAPVPLSGIPA